MTSNRHTDLCEELKSALIRDDLDDAVIEYIAAALMAIDEHDYEDEQQIASEIVEILGQFSPGFVEYSNEMQQRTALNLLNMCRNQAAKEKGTIRVVDEMVSISSSRRTIAISPLSSAESIQGFGNAQSDQTGYKLEVQSKHNDCLSNEGVRKPFTLHQTPEDDKLAQRNQCCEQQDVDLEKKASDLICILGDAHVSKEYVKVVLLQCHRSVDRAAESLFVASENGTLERDFAAWKISTSHEKVSNKNCANEHDVIDHIDSSIRESIARKFHLESVPLVDLSKGKSKRTGLKAGADLNGLSWGKETDRKKKSGTMSVRYRDGVVVSTKGDKYIVEKSPEWDGGSRGRVKLKGKRGVGWA